MLIAVFPALKVLKIFFEIQDMVGDYHFAGLGRRTRTLKIRTVNLLDVLDWKKFIRDFKDIFV